MHFKSVSYQISCQMTVICVVLLLHCLANGASGIHSNDIPEDLDPTQCDRMVEDVSRTERDTVVQDPPRLTGKWVSEGCEVRSGPEFLLRSYTFLRNNTFRLLQYHYRDESCTSPLYTLTVRGRYSLKGRSWITPGATEADYTLTKVTVTAHSADVAEDLANRVNLNCPGQVPRRWRPYREYVVLSLPEEVNANNNHPPGVPGNSYQRRNAVAYGSSRSELRLMVTEDLDCLSALHAVFHELQLLRVQRRPPGPPDDRHPRHELLLGDVHSRLELRSSYRPTAFQTPLLKSDQAHGCHRCHLVSRSSARSPPHLPAIPRLPAILDGEWVSSRCEVRPLGLFLTRRLVFHSQERTWHGEYRFFSDPACAVASFVAEAEGRYSGSALYNPNHVDGSTDFDFRVERAKLTVLDRSMADNLQGDPLCIAGGVWRVGVSRDLTPSNGCAPLGIIVPSIEYELVRIETHVQGTYLLLMGQADTDNRRRGPRERPTAYQPPLLQCRRLPPELMDNSLNPMHYARVGYMSSDAEHCATGRSLAVLWVALVLRCLV